MLRSSLRWFVCLHVKQSHIGSFSWVGFHGRYGVHRFCCSTVYFCASQSSITKNPTPPEHINWSRLNDLTITVGSRARGLFPHCFWNYNHNNRSLSVSCFLYHWTTGVIRIADRTQCNYTFSFLKQGFFHIQFLKKWLLKMFRLYKVNKNDFDEKIQDHKIRIKKHQLSLNRVRFVETCMLFGTLTHSIGNYTPKIHLLT